MTIFGDNEQQKCEKKLTKYNFSGHYDDILTITTLVDQVQ